MKRSALLAVAAAVLASCTYPDETISGYVPPNSLWFLQTINDEPIDATISLAFPEKGKIWGSGPCNRYSARQSAPLPWFQVSGIASTKKACRDLPLETRYFQSLRNMRDAEVLGYTLLLSGPTGSMVFLRKEV